MRIDGIFDRRKPEDIFYYRATLEPEIRPSSRSLPSAMPDFGEVITPSPLYHNLLLPMYGLCLLYNQ